MDAIAESPHETDTGSQTPQQPLSVQQQHQQQLQQQQHAFFQQHPQEHQPRPPSVQLPHPLAGFINSNKPASAPPIGGSGPHQQPFFFGPSSARPVMQHEHPVRLQAPPHPIKRRNTGGSSSLPPNHPLAGLSSPSAIQQQQYQASKLQFYHTRTPVYVASPTFTLKDFELLDTLGTCITWMILWRWSLNDGMIRHGYIWTSIFDQV